MATQWGHRVHSIVYIDLNKNEIPAHLNWCSFHCHTAEAVHQESTHNKKVYIAAIWSISFTTYICIPVHMYYGISQTSHHPSWCHHSFHHSYNSLPMHGENKITSIDLCGVNNTIVSISSFYLKSRSLRLGPIGLIIHL